MADERDKWFGLHEQLETPALRAKLSALGLEDLAVWQKKVDADELPTSVVRAESGYPSLIWTT